MCCEVPCVLKFLMRNSKPSQPMSGPGCLSHFCRAVNSITFQDSGSCIDMCNFCTSVCASGESKFARIDGFKCGGWSSSLKPYSFFEVHEACSSLVTFGSYDIELDALETIWSIPYVLVPDSIKSNHDSMPRTGENHQLWTDHFFLNVFAIMVIKYCFVIYFWVCAVRRCIPNVNILCDINLVKLTNMCVFT